MANYAIGDLVDVWDGDVQRWVAGKVEAFQSMLQVSNDSIMVVRVDQPDPGPIAVNKVPAVYAIVDMGMVRRRD